MDWKIIDSEYLVKHKYFTARKDKCQTPDGKIIDEYYVVELNVSVCAMGLTQNNEVILVRQYRHPVKKVLLEIPGGFIDKDEDPEKAIAREMLEETGYEFEKIEYVGETAANPGVLDNYTKLFLATGGKKVAKQKLDSNEEIEIILMPLQELIDLVLENKLEQSLHITCIFYALLKMGKLDIKK
ncbi:NUDIX hydrolase [soil metagenome]